MSEEEDIPDITVALDVADANLRDRLSAILGGVPMLRLVATGEAADTILTSSVMQTADSMPDLTERERQVLAILAEGASNREIGHRLKISIHTVKFHVASILDKLDATGRTDAVAHAARIGVIQL